MRRLILSDEKYGVTRSKTPWLIHTFMSGFRLMP